VEEPPAALPFSCASLQGLPKREMLRKLKEMTVVELQDAIVALGGKPKKGLKSAVMQALVDMIDPPAA
jgi:hypothetical protein